MIDYRTKIGKMIDKTRFVVECVSCKKRYIVNDIKELPSVCSCSHKDTFVVLDNMSVITKG